MRGTPLLLLAVLALGACSRTGGVAVTTVVENYLYDLGNRDYSAACQQLTDALRASLGDCPSALRRRHGNLPVAEYDELRDADVKRVTYHGSTKAQVYPQDIVIRQPHKPTKRSIAANHATNGQPLELTKLATAWRISGGGV
jgi:hypothetical protein